MAKPYYRQIAVQRPMSQNIDRWYKRGVLKILALKYMRTDNEVYCKHKGY